MDTTPKPEAPLRQVRVETIDGKVTIVIYVRTKHTRGVLVHRYPLTAYEASMLTAEIENHLTRISRTTEPSGDGA